MLPLFLATGQDAANIIEGSQGITHELRGEDLYFSATLPPGLLFCREWERISICSKEFSANGMSDESRAKQLMQIDSHI